MTQSLHKPTNTPVSSHEEADRILRTYNSSSRDKFKHITDVKFTEWVSDNLEHIETLLLFIQRETARPATTAEVDVNLNAHMLAQSQILNRTYEIAEQGNFHKQNR